MLFIQTKARQSPSFITFANIQDVIMTHLATTAQICFSPDQPSWSTIARYAACAAATDAPGMEQR